MKAHDVRSFHPGQVSRALRDGAPLRADALLMSVLVHPHAAACRQAVAGLGAARVLAEIDELERLGLWWELTLTLALALAL